ncbi:MAG: M1 family metallopeptidase, partial [candidate division WOR-3 bacterium]
MRLTALLMLSLVALSVGTARIPGPEGHETKWFLPLPDPPPVFAESTHEYDTRFFRLDVNLPMTSGAMDAHAGIWIVSEVAGLDTAVFDFRNLVCDSVKLNDTMLGFSTTYLQLMVVFDEPLASGDSVLLDVFYHRTAGTQNRGFYWYEQDPPRNRLHTVCYTLTQPENARYWFPCWDHPWDKAERGCQVNITVPDSFTACANGLLDSTTSNSDGTKTFWWTHRYPISSYLVNFGASVFSVWTQWSYLQNGDSVPTVNYIWPEDSAVSLSSFRNVPNMLEFFSDSIRFGLYPFPEEKYGHLAVYPFGAGGMEHQTMTTVHRQWVTRGSESGIAHELAHMWYGDFLTCFIWADIWLNEGGASYLDPLWMEHFYGHSRFLQDMEDYRRYFLRSDSVDRHPIYDPGLGRLFDYGHTYCKAAWVNHMLRYVEGDTVFDQPGIWWQTERAYLDSFAYGTATTEDRKRIHEAHTGLELDWFFDDWVYMAGFPNYSVNWFGRHTTDGWEVVVDIGQNNGAQAPECFHMPVELLVGTAAGDTLFHFGITQNPQRSVFPVSAEPNSVVFDPGKWILSKHTITSGIENELDPGAGVSRPTLHSAAPNPAPNAAIVRFSLPNAQDVSVLVYDATG